MTTFKAAFLCVNFLIFTCEIVSASESVEFVDHFHYLESRVSKDISLCNHLIETACLEGEGYKIKSSDHEDIVHHAFSAEFGNENPVFVQARKYYENCVSESEDVETFLKKLGKDNGGWPALDDWDSEKFNRVRALAILAKNGIQTVLKPTIEYEGDDLHVKVYHHSIQIKNVEDLVRKVVHDEGKVAEIVDDYKVVKRQLSYIMPRGGRNAGIVTLQFSADGELSYDLFDYKTYYSTYTDKVPNEKVSIQFLEFHRLDQLFKRFAKADTKQLANFLMVIAIRDISEDINCDLVTYNMYAPVIVSTALTHYFNEEDKRKRFEVFDVHKNTLKEFADGTFYMDLNDFEEETKHALELAKDLLPSQSEMDAAYSHGHDNEVTRKYFGYDSDKRKALEKFLEAVIPNHNKPMIHHFASTDYHMWVSHCTYYNFEEKFDLGLLFEKYEKIEKCLEPYYAEYTAMKLENTNINAAQIKTLAIKLALKDYEFWLSAHPEQAEAHKEVLGIMTEKRFFFYSLATTYCDQAEEDQKEVTVALMHTNEFTNSFNCTSVNCYNVR